jgi:mannosyltransferase OCH1-like enzyme
MDVKMHSGIPRIIHQTSGRKALPPLVQQEITDLQVRNPGWDYRFYSDESVIEYIGQYYPQHLDIFLRINPRYGAARADLFRYLLMFREGGVYLDIKSTFRQPLDEVLRTDDCYLLSHWNNGPGTAHELWGTYPEIVNPRGEFQQCLLICEPKHAFLAAVIECVIANLHNYRVERDGVGRNLVHITGPVAYTLAITPLLSVHRWRLADSESELCFDYNFYNRTSGNKHKSLFDYHYSWLEEPVVLQQPQYLAT